jgi:hypothetical protein
VYSKRRRRIIIRRRAHVLKVMEGMKEAKKFHTTARRIKAGFQPQTSFCKEKFNWK